jgi:type II secretion system protein J
MKRRAFTLLEILIALAACAVILAAIYGLFSKAVRLRDSAMARTRDVQVRARAAAVLRNDLQNALVSGGTLAASLQGSAAAQGSSFPGYLKFTTTTAPDSEELPAPDVQQVEYYIITDPGVVDSKAGLLVRAVDRKLLAPVRETPAEEPLLEGVAGLEVSFYDGQSWKDSWEVTETEKTLPQAVRVRIKTAAPSADEHPAPIEVLVPWTTQSGIEKT